MHHFVQLVAKFVCLLFGAGQVTYSWFINSLQKLKTRLMRVNKTVKLWATHQNIELKAAKMLYRAEGNCSVGISF